MSPSAIERIERERASNWAALCELAATAPRDVQAEPPAPVPDPAALEAAELARQAARLRARLLELTGYAAPSERP
jgi:hypothetical protein